MHVVFDKDNYLSHWSCTDCGYEGSFVIHDNKKGRKIRSLYQEQFVTSKKKRIKRKRKIRE